MPPAAWDLVKDVLHKSLNPRKAFANRNSLFCWASNVKNSLAQRVSHLVTNHKLTVCRRGFRTCAELLTEFSNVLAENRTEKAVRKHLYQAGILIFGLFQ